MKSAEKDERSLAVRALIVASSAGRSAGCGGATASARSRAARAARSAAAAAAAAVLFFVPRTQPKPLASTAKRSVPPGAMSSSSPR